LKLIRDQGIVCGITLRDFIASFYLPKASGFILHVAHARAFVLLVLVALAACRRQPLVPAHQESAPDLARLRATLALVPAEARIVMALDLERLRASELGKTLLSGPAKEAALLLDGFARGTGLDLLTQVRHVLVAVPGERQADDRLVLVAETRALDRPRATAWLRARQDGKTAAFVLPPDRIVIAKGAWAPAVTSLAKSTGSEQSAARDEELRRLCERVVPAHAWWLAAIVPIPLRQRLSADARFPDLASLSRLSASLAIEGGLRAEAVAELSNDADARSLVHRLNTFLNTAKHHPDMLAQGLAPYLEAIRLGAEGPNVSARLELPATQAEDLLLRARDLLKSGPAKAPR
jgi:hypothetical protein